MLLGYDMHAKAVNVGIYEWHVICMDMLSHNNITQTIKLGRVSWVFLNLQPL